MSRSPDELVADVRDTDPDVLDADGVAVFLSSVAELRSWLDARQVRATRRQRELAAEGRAPDPRSSLTDKGRQSSKDARAADEREQTCTAMPGFEDALNDGSISAGHIDAVSSATKNLDDAERSEFISCTRDLLDTATKSGVDAFDRECRELAKNIRARHNADADVDELERQRAQSKISRWVDPTTGMHKTLIEADPVTDRTLWAAIQQARAKLRLRDQQTGSERTSWDRLTVDALVDAVSDGDRRGGGSPGGIVVHIDVDSLAEGRHEHTLCETDSGVDLPIETVRRMACEADLIPVVLDGNGVVLDEGRAKRLATHEQRLALQAMHTTCAEPNCSVTFDDCRIHHLDPWAAGGRTDLDRMVPLCEAHHHRVHEGGWTLTVAPDRTATWIRPDGTPHWTGSLLDRRPAA